VRSERRRCVALACAGLLLAGCAGSGTLDPATRMRVEASALEQWRALEAGELEGLYESERIEGEVAAALWKVEYHFDAGGAFSGAALVFGERGPEFQTLNGAWSVPAAGLLRLGEDEARAALDGERLRLELGGGVLILRREALR
jgi:ABC-type nitrate/sulfonate/bicarbonate transport system substrate-binding protein